jgi:hypothetical protein
VCLNIESATRKTERQYRSNIHLYGLNEKNIILFRSKNLKRRSHLEGLGVNVRIILKWILNRIMCFGMDPSAAGERPVEGIVLRYRMSNNGSVVVELLVLL